MEKNQSRRDFIKTTTAVAAGFMIVPRFVLGGKGFIAPSDRVNVAGIGVGGMGFNNMKNLGDFATVTALCDVDFGYASKAFQAFPKATQFRDFREMLAKKGRDIDAVVIATPDNTHALIAMHAMERGKHVYVQKPLTHDIFEARALTEAASKYKKLVTQMGNQGHSNESNIELAEWVKAGILGDVNNVEVWTNRPIWPQGLPYPTAEMPLPNGLTKEGWDLWLGPAEYRAFNAAIYHFKWRGWWPFGTGALGDMACHLVDPAFRALNLGYPTSVEASSSTFYDQDFHAAAETSESAPGSSKIVFEFPARGNMPPVKLTWTDGGIIFDRPADLKDTDPLGWDGGGVLLHGSKTEAMTGCYGVNTTLVPFEKMSSFQKPTASLRRIAGNSGGHEKNWIEAIRKDDPSFASSPFSYAGPLTETILLGNIALRTAHVKGSNGKAVLNGPTRLHWDGPGMKITNVEEANQFVKREYRKGWNLNS